MAKHRKKSAGGLPAKGRLRDMADSLWSLAVRADWGDRCAVCGTTLNLNAHHLIRRGCYPVRYLLENGICLCATHHKWCGEVSPHSNGHGFAVWIEEHYPARHQWFKDTRASGAHKALLTVNVEFYLDVLRQLRQYVEPEEFERIVGVKLARHLDCD